VSRCAALRRNYLSNLRIAPSFSRRERSLSSSCSRTAPRVLFVEYLAPPVVDFCTAQTTARWAVSL
jgi:hypothetical protein